MLPSIYVLRRGGGHSARVFYLDLILTPQDILTDVYGYYAKNKIHITNYDMYTLLMCNKTILVGERGTLLPYDIAHSIGHCFMYTAPYNHWIQIRDDERAASLQTMLNGWIY